MISKSQQNMAILDEETKFSQTMDEKPKNLSLDKVNCDNSCHEENMPDQDDPSENKDILQNVSSHKNTSENDELNIKEAKKYGPTVVP